MHFQHPEPQKISFFDFFRTFRATPPPDSSQNRQKHAKYVFFWSLLLLSQLPDRAQAELVKNHQKYRKSRHFAYFSKLLRHGPSSIATERSTTRKIFIFFWSLQLAIQLRVSGAESTPASENKCLKI